MEEHGPKKWSLIASLLKTKSSKQCRRRWKNHLDMDSKATTWTPGEDNLLVRYHRELGNKWTEISKRFGDRTDNAVKNRWHALCRKQPELAEEESPLTTVGVRRGTRTRQLTDDFSSDLSEDLPVRKRRRGGSETDPTYGSSDLNGTSKRTSLTDHPSTTGEMRLGMLYNPLGMLLPGGVQTLPGGMPAMPTPFDRTHSDRNTMEGILQQLLPPNHPLNPKGGSPYEIEVAELPTSATGIFGMETLPFDGSAALQEWLAAGLALAGGGGGGGAAGGGGGGEVSLPTELEAALNSQSVSINELLQWLNSTTAEANLSAEAFPELMAAANAIQPSHNAGEVAANATNPSSRGGGGGLVRRSHRTLTDEEPTLQPSLSTGSGLSSGQLSSGQRDLLVRLFSQVRDSLELQQSGQQQQQHAEGQQQQQQQQQQQVLPNLSDLPPLDSSDAAEIQKLLSLGIARSLSLGFTNGMNSLLAAAGGGGDAGGGGGGGVPPISRMNSGLGGGAPNFGGSAGGDGGGRLGNTQGTGSIPIAGNRGKDTSTPGSNLRDGMSGGIDPGVSGTGGKHSGGRSGSRSRKGNGGGGLNRTGSGINRTSSGGGFGNLGSVLEKDVGGGSKEGQALTAEEFDTIIEVSI